MISLRQLGEIVKATSEHTVLCGGVFAIAIDVSIHREK